MTSDSEREKMVVEIALALINATRQHYGMDKIAWDFPALSTANRNLNLRQARAILACPSLAALLAPEPDYGKAAKGILDALKTSPSQAREEVLGTEIEPHKPGAMRLVPFDLLHALWCYGNLSTVENVIYPGGTHRARLLQVQDCFPAIRALQTSPAPTSIRDQLHDRDSSWMEANHPAPAKEELPFRTDDQLHWQREAANMLDNCGVEHLAQSKSQTVSDILEFAEQYALVHSPAPAQSDQVRELREIAGGLVQDSVPPEVLTDLKQRGRKLLAEMMPPAHIHQQSTQTEK